MSKAQINAISADHANVPEMRRLTFTLIRLKRLAIKRPLVYKKTIADFLIRRCFGDWCEVERRPKRDNIRCGSFR